MSAIRFQYLDGFVTRCAIDNDDFKWPVVLPEARINGFADKFSLNEAGNDDGNKRLFSQILHGSTALDETDQFNRLET